MSAFDAAADLAAFFSTDDAAIAAVYRPASGPSVALAALLLQPTVDVALLGGASTAPALRAQVSAADLAQPRAGDAIELPQGGAVYRVKAWERDAAGQIWTLTLGAGQ